MADDPQAQPPAQPEPSPSPGKTGKTVEERLDAQDQKIDGLSGKLDQVLSAVGGSPKASGSTPPSASGATEQPPAGPSIAEQVRQGVAEIEAKKKADAEAQAAKDADQAWRKGVDEAIAERRPAEPKTGRKGKLQRAMFGRADER